MYRLPLTLLPISRSPFRGPFTLLARNLTITLSRNLARPLYTTKPLKMSSLNEQLQLGNLFDVKGKVALVTGGGMWLPDTSSWFSCYGVSIDETQVLASV